MNIAKGKRRREAACRVWGTDLSVVAHEHFPPDNLHHSQTVHLGHVAEGLHHPHPLQQLHQEAQESQELLAVLIHVKHHMAAPSEEDERKPISSATAAIIAITT